MITVAGEVLIDLIVDPAGHIDPRFGGGPFNVARAVGPALADVVDKYPSTLDDTGVEFLVARFVGADRSDLGDV